MVAEKIMNVAMVVSAWIKQNQQIIVTVLKVAAVVVAVGIALTVLGTIISGLGTMPGVLITVVTTVVAVLKVLAAVIAFLVSPIGLVSDAATEAGVKQFNKRVIGTEQFWNLPTVEPILALRALWLSNDDRRQHYWLYGAPLRQAA